MPAESLALSPVAWRERGRPGWGRGERKWVAGLVILTYGFLLWLMLQLLNVPITPRLDSLIKMPKFSSWPRSSHVG